MKLALIVTAILISGCSQGPVDEENAATVVSPPPGAVSAPQSLAEQYPLFRAAALEAARAEMEDSGEPPYLLRGESFDVIDCWEDGRNPEVRAPEGKAGLVELTARRIAFLDLNFAESGYSPDVYSGPLRAYEDWMLKAVMQDRAPNSEAIPWGPADEKARLRLAAQVEANRAKLQPGSPKVVAMGECGAGESEYRIKLQPDDGRAWLTTRFAFNICKAKGLDPWDRQKCDRWDEVDTDQTMALAGTYVYQASWRNGAGGRGAKRLESLAGDPATVPVVTIRPD